MPRTDREAEAPRVEEPWQTFLSESELVHRRESGAGSAPESREQPKRWLRVAVIALSVVAAAEAIVIAFLLVPRVVADGADVGAFVVTSTPLGATVHVDDVAVGTTPYKGELASGPRRITLKQGDGTWSQEMAIDRGREAAVHVVWASVPAAASTSADTEAGRINPDPPAAPPTDNRPRRSTPASASGWLSLVIPVAAHVYEKGALLGTSEMPRIMVTAGRHELEIVNAALGFKTRRSVQVLEGKIAVVDVAVPDGVVAINALPWADVTVGTRALGQTPLANVALPLGSHEVVFRHPEFGERRRTVVVVADQKVRLGIDMRKD